MPIRPVHATLLNPNPMLSAKLEHYLCVTCGTQFAATDAAPEQCPICRDERQYVGHRGQRWTTLDAMRNDGFRNVVREQEPNLVSITTEPHFGIGQRAFLVRTPSGNLLWDCVSLIDDETVRAVKALGGIRAIAISHPHYYSSMVEWSAAFEDAPIFLHAADRQWVQRPDVRIQFWEDGTKSLFDGLTLIHSPGHFDGFQVLHWPSGAEGRGVMFSGDQPQVCADPDWVSFMWSYPNYIPLGADAVRRILQTLEPSAFDRIYGAFGHSLVKADAKAVVRRSAERYLRHVGF